MSEDLLLTVVFVAALVLSGLMFAALLDETSVLAGAVVVGAVLLPLVWWSGRKGPVE